MLRNMGRDDYHTFRTHFWDWRREIQMTSPSIFHYNRLGERQEIAGQSHVHGNLYSNGWNTICWYMEAVEKRMKQREQSVILTLDLCFVAHLFHVVPPILAVVPMITGLQ